MRSLYSIALACALAAALAAPASADTTMPSGMAMPSMAPGAMGSGAMGAHPTCPADDPMVGVNTETKMYLTKEQMHAKMAGMTPDQMHAAMQKNHMTLMCTSKAKAMGAKPMAM